MKAASSLEPSVTMINRQDFISVKDWIFSSTTVIALHLIKLFLLYVWLIWNTSESIIVASWGKFGATNHPLPLTRVSLAESVVFWLTGQQRRVICHYILIRYFENDPYGAYHSAVTSYAETSVFYFSICISDTTTTS